jgi:hypothetical protein
MPESARRWPSNADVWHFCSEKHGGSSLLPFALASSAKSAQEFIKDLQDRN